MTIITALSDDKSTWLGHNSASTIGDTPLEGLDPWVKFGDWALGITGTSYHQDFLELRVKQLEENSETPMQLCEFIRKIFLEHQISIDGGDYGTPKFGIWCILVNKSGGIWDIGNRMSCSKIKKNKLWATGSGVDYALGADYATLQVAPKTSIKNRVRIATEAAILHETTCPGEVVLMKFN